MTTEAQTAAGPEELRVNDDAYATEHYDDAYFETGLRIEQTRLHALRCGWLEKYLKPGPGDRIVDLGCGVGIVDKFLASKGATVHGVDLHPKAVAGARRLNEGNDKATFQVGDASNVPNLEDGSFDKAVSCDVTEHCGYDVMLGIFREAYRLLRPGGLYFTYTPNPKHWVEKLKEYGVMKSDPTHTGLRTTPVIREALEKVGFEIEANPMTSCMMPGLAHAESAWRFLRIAPQLANYRVILLAKKPV